MAGGNYSVYIVKTAGDAFDLYSIAIIQYAKDMTYHRCDFDRICLNLYNNIQNIHAIIIIGNFFAHIYHVTILFQRQILLSSTDIRTTRWLLLVQ